LIHVVLDTNIYRNNPDRTSLNFKAIEKLANAGLVKLHIPYIVEREFQTQQREIYSKDLTKALSGLSGLSRKQLSQDVLEKVNAIKASLEAESESILTDAEIQLIHWANSINANRYPLCLEQAHDALEAYFQGKPPFKQAKVREDIPDSFVVQAINKLHVGKHQIHVVADDKKVRDAFSQVDTVFTYKNLPEFIESVVIQNELKDLDLLSNLDAIEHAIESFENENNEISSNISNKIGEAIVWKSIEDSSIPDDNNEAIINGYDEAEYIELCFSELAYYGNGLFGIPFSVKIVVGAIYYIFKSDYYCMDSDREHVPSVSDHNDHYFEAEDEFEIIVKGTASIAIDRDNIDLEEFSECVDYDSIAIDEIDSIELC